MSRFAKGDRIEHVSRAFPGVAEVFDPQGPSGTVGVFWPGNIFANPPGYYPGECFAPEGHPKTPYQLLARMRRATQSLMDMHKTLHNLARDLEEVACDRQLLERMELVQGALETAADLAQDLLIRQMDSLCLPEARSPEPALEPEPEEVPEPALGRNVVPLHRKPGR